MENSSRGRLRTANDEALDMLLKLTTITVSLCNVPVLTQKSTEEILTAMREEH